MEQRIMVHGAVRRMTHPKGVLNKVSRFARPIITVAFYARIGGYAACIELLRGFSPHFITS